jgi:hypothetical protein
MVVVDVGEDAIDVERNVGVLDRAARSVDDPSQLVRTAANRAAIPNHPKRRIPHLPEHPFRDKAIRWTGLGCLWNSLSVSGRMAKCAVSSSLIDPLRFRTTLKNSMNNGKASSLASGANSVRS